MLYCTMAWQEWFDQLQSVNKSGHDLLVGLVQVEQALDCLHMCKVTKPKFCASLLKCVVQFKCSVCCLTVGSDGFLFVLAGFGHLLT